MTFLGQLAKDKQIQQKYTQLLFAIRDNDGVQCEQVPDIFFPEDQGRPNIAEIQLAKNICRDCPVKILCADYAVTAEEPYGIFGGMTPQERNLLRKLKTI